MKIALLGYGKMGKAVEEIALSRKHNIISKVDIEEGFTEKTLSNVDVAIDFSTPESAYHNILRCFDVNVPIVIGTTGWLDKYEEVKRKCIAEKQTLFFAPNFSIGVNIFFEINKRLAQLMNDKNDYEVTMEEVHHTQKMDSPSGTAIRLAEDIIDNINEKKKWVNNCTAKDDELEILSIREGHVFGIHNVKYHSEVDSIEIKHTAKSRKGFALGAVLAAEWVIGKKGVYGMKDLLEI